MGFGMGFRIGMGLWQMGWDDGIWDGIWDGMGVGILPFPLIWVASISNNILSDIKPSFPPTLKPNDLIQNNRKSSNSNNKPKSLPNAFIAYRMALIEEYRIKN